MKAVLLLIVQALLAVLLLANIACFAAETSAVLRVSGGLTTVEFFEGSRVQLAEGEMGLVIWADGDRDRWQLFSTRWSRPSSSSSKSFSFDLDSGSRGGGWHSTSDADFGQLSTLLSQVRSPDVFRDAGNLIAPYPGAALLDPRITIRRESAGNEEKLPAVEAVIWRDGKEVLRIPFAEDIAVIAWKDIRNLPDEFKAGLSPGNYRLQLPVGTGVDDANFVLLGSEERGELLRNELMLGGLLKDQNHPLFTHLMIEKLLEHDPPLLCDAMDTLNRVPNSERTTKWQALKLQVDERLKDPKQEVGPPDVDQPTGDLAIDAVRSQISNGQWDKALRDLDSIDSGTDPRRLALVHLYRGVILSEAGPGNEQEATAAFATAINRMSNLPNGSRDLYRAHNNFANFLLGRATDRLHNHAFQIAAGVRHPLLTALKNWSDARSHYEQAKKFAETSQDEYAVKLNLARAHALLADIVQTLSHPGERDQRFDVAEKAAREQSRTLAQEIVDREVELQDASLLVAIAEEVLAHLALRDAKISEAREHARSAQTRYLDIGSITGVESTSRLLGLCAKKSTDSENSEEALRQFFISEQLAEILRDRYPADEVGLSRAGFFARRAYVTEHIVELLITAGRHAEALVHVEKSKARSLQDALATRRIVIDNRQSLAPDGFLKKWPHEVVALEYFFGSERVWLFLIDTNGNVTSHQLNDERNTPIESRVLTDRVQKVISYLDLLGPGSASRVGEGRRIAYGGKFDWSWQDELHALHQILLPPAARERLHDAPTCLIVPHHILHYFPFAALVTKPDLKAVDPSSMPLPRFLVDEPLSICYAPSLATWRALRDRPNRPLDRVQAVGVGDFDGQLKSLPGVRKELANLKNAFGEKVGSVLTDRDVTRKNILDLFKQPGVLSLATHGMKVPDEPLESFLVCRDESNGVTKVTAADLYSSQIESDLVVLNACYGGFGDRSPLPGDELYGVQRALIHSGARTVVSGLWDIYDSTAPDLVGDFYRNVAAGESASQGLAEAQRKYLQNWRNAPQQPLRFLTHPYYWAVFTVTGDDRTGSGREPNGVAADQMEDAPDGEKQIQRIDPVEDRKDSGAKTTPRKSQAEVVPPSSTAAVERAAAASHQVDDQEFAGFVDQSRVALAIGDLNTALLVDLALQTAEGERVLGRPCRYISAKSLAIAAIRVATRRGDTKSLKRAGQLSERIGDEEVERHIAVADRLLDRSRGESQDLVVSPERLSVESFIALRELVGDIELASMTKDRRRLDIAAEDLATIPNLSEVEKKQVEQLLSESRGFGGLITGAIPALYATNRMSVAMEVLVNGKPLPVIQHQGRSYVVVPKLDVEYAIRVVNRGPRRVLALAVVDGLSVMDGKPSAEDGQGYVLRPGEAYTVLGWRRDAEHVAAFRFVSPEQSDAAQTMNAIQIGTIRLLAFEEDAPMHYVPTNKSTDTWRGDSTLDNRSFNMPTASSPRQPAAGTGRGHNLDSKVVNVDFRRSSNKRMVRLHYVTAEWLRNAGAVLEDRGMLPANPRSSANQDRP